MPNDVSLSVSVVTCLKGESILGKEQEDFHNFFDNHTL